MSVSFSLNQAHLIKALRQIADEAEVGTAVLEEMTISADIAEDAPKDGWETYRLTGRKTMQMSWWAKKETPRHTTIESDEDVVEGGTEGARKSLCQSRLQG